MKLSPAFAVALLMSGLSTIAAAESFVRLNAGQIRAQLIGNTLTDRVHWSRRFRAGGTMSTTDLGKSGSGRWKIESDRLCFGSAADALVCYEVWASRGEVRLRAPGRLEEIVYVERN